MSLTGSRNQSLAAIVREIQLLSSSYGAAIEHLDQDAKDVLNASNGNFAAIDGAGWVRVANKEAISKLQILIENNFRYIETVDLLATTRYVFECLVWLKLLNSNADYGVVFYYKTIKDQISHQKQLREKYLTEATYFEDSANEETARLAQTMKMLATEDADEDTFAKAVAKVQSELDDKARRNFSTYWHDARTNGYGFQAHLIRTKAVLSLDESLSELECERQRALSTLTSRQEDMIKARWNWKNKASDVGMLAAYEFIYSFTSRLLHATPSSMFTNQKNLEAVSYTHLTLPTIYSV